jgi:hypothetical protein
MIADKDVRFVAWDGRSAGSWTDAIDGADAIVNFTGSGLSHFPRLVRLTFGSRVV